MPEKLALKNKEGEELKIYTILFGLNSGLFSSILGVHDAIAYTSSDAIDQATKSHGANNSNSSTPFFYEIKKVTLLKDYLRFIQEQVEINVLPTMGQPKYVPVRLPHFTNVDKPVEYVNKLLKAVPALVEGETEQKILTNALQKILNLYGNRNVSKSISNNNL